MLCQENSAGTGSKSFRVTVQCGPNFDVAKKKTCISRGEKDASNRPSFCLKSDFCIGGLGEMQHFNGTTAVFVDN